MGGEGSAFNMISVMKSNRALLRKKDYFYLRKEYLNSVKRKSLDLKEATPEQLQIIRAEIKANNKRIQNRKVVAIPLIFLLTAVLIFCSIKLGRWMFEDVP